MRHTFSLDTKANDSSRFVFIAVAVRSSAYPRTVNRLDQIVTVAPMNSSSSAIGVSGAHFRKNAFFRLSSICAASSRRLRQSSSRSRARLPQSTNHPSRRRALLARSTHQFHVAILGVIKQRKRSLEVLRGVHPDRLKSKSGLGAHRKI
jgi:hypothetical protein